MRDPLPGDAPVIPARHAVAMADARPYIPVMPAPTLISAEDLPRLSPPDKKTELVRGVMVVREPPGYRHGKVAGRLFGIIRDFVEPRGMGDVLAAETGFKLASNPDTVRAPDVAFVHRDRAPDPPPVDFAAFAPDLAVEVLSPGDRPGEVLTKVADYLNAGCRLVWVVDPERRQARIYRADGTEGLEEEDGALSGEDVVPGLSIRLIEVP